MSEFRGMHKHCDFAYWKIFFTIMMIENKTEKSMDVNRYLEKKLYFFSREKNQILTLISRHFQEIQSRWHREVFECGFLYSTNGPPNRTKTHARRPAAPVLYLYMRFAVVWYAILKTVILKRVWAHLLLQGEFSKEIARTLGAIFFTICPGKKTVLENLALLIS